jgi:hypothetical protein
MDHIPFGWHSWGQFPHGIRPCIAASNACNFVSSTTIVPPIDLTEDGSVEYTHAVSKWRSKGTGYGVTITSF